MTSAEKLVGSILYLIIGSPIEGYVITQIFVALGKVGAPDFTGTWALISALFFVFNLLVILDLFKEAVGKAF